ncbi:MAG: FAD:protein FMN transferase [Salinibacterium sp.]|nr:FAD:protein FMN transferase [Salinibacterium sp.]
MLTSNSPGREALQGFLFSTGESLATTKRTVAAMGGTATITMVGATAPVLDAAVHLLGVCEELWSRFLRTSDISRLNWAEGHPVNVHSSTIRLIDAMVEGYNLTRGAFDPTMLPAVIREGYGQSTTSSGLVTTLPSSSVAGGDPAKIEITGTTVTLPEGMTLDPGGIGKGLAADMVCELIMDAGAWGVVVDVGGDIVVGGRPAQGFAWDLGVENPFEPTGYSALVRLSRGALVTSSQRKRRFGPVGFERHHIMDARTGASAETRVQTVSVIAATGARAESLTKPGFAWDTDEYLRWLPSVGAAGLVIDDSGVATASGNWERYQ